MTSSTNKMQLQTRNHGGSNFDQSALTPRHRWFHFKEGFSPSIVQTAIESSGRGKDELILDPFSGSGTSALVASSLGLESVGIEVNPFMAFIGRTKHINYKQSSFENHLPAVLAGIRSGKKSNLQGFSTFSEKPGLSKWLFNDAVLKAFEGGWSTSASLPAKARDLVRLALIGTAMDTCNAVRDGKCLRYRKDWTSTNFGKSEFITEFEARAEIIASDLGSTYLPKTASIYNEDIRQSGAKSISKKFSLFITSPPYLNSFDYSDIYRPELFLGKFLKDGAGLRELRLKTLRSHVQASWHHPVRTDFGLIYKKTIESIEEKSEGMWDSRLPMMIQAYFEDMESVLTKLRKAALDDAQLWLIVSTSAYAGVEVPVDLILAELGERCGWNLSEVGVLRSLRSSGQHAKTITDSGSGDSIRLRESAVILRAKR